MMWGGLDDYDIEVIAPKLNGVGSDESIPYLDKAYKGKVVNQRGMRLLIWNRECYSRMLTCLRRC